jgi:hypothetical protein
MEPATDQVLTFQPLPTLHWASSAIFPVNLELGILGIFGVLLSFHWASWLKRQRESGIFGVLLGFSLMTCKKRP